GKNHANPQSGRLAEALRRERRACGSLRHAGRGRAAPAARRAAGDRARLRRRRDRRFPEGPCGGRLLMADRRKLVWPITLIAVGVLFLAYNLGYLKFSELKDIIGTWWPLILIALGIDGIISKT